MTRVALAAAGCALCIALCAGELPSLEEEDPQTLSQMLHWSLQHQDLDALHAKAEAIRQRERSGELEPGVLHQATLPAGDGGGPRIRQIRPESSDPVAAALRQKELSDAWSTLMPDMIARLRDALDRATAPDPPPGGEGEAARTVLDELLAGLPPDELERIPAGTAPPSASRLHALWQLEELVEDLDLAKDFAKIGGFARLLPLLEPVAAPTVEALREREAAVWVFGTAAQNEPEVQGALVRVGVPAALISLLLEPAPVEPHAHGHAEARAALRSKALFALSAISRSSAAGARALLGSNGVQALAAAAADRHDGRSARKALTLLTDIARLAMEEAAAPGGGAVAADVRAALARNGSSVCEALAGQLARSAAEADLDGSEKALDAAWAFFDLAHGTRQPGQAQPWACAREVRPALQAVAERGAASGAAAGSAQAAAAAAEGELGVELAEPDIGVLEEALDGADNGRAELWARLGASARQLESAGSSGSEPSVEAMTHPTSS